MLVVGICLHGCKYEEIAYAKGSIISSNVAKMLVVGVCLHVCIYEEMYSMNSYM